MEKQVDIRRVGPEDAEGVTELARQTFRETYGAYNDPDELRMYMERELTRTVLEEEMKADGSAWYIASLDGVAVGFLKIRWDREPDNLQGRRALELQRIYVLQEYRGFSIGTSLINTAKAYARAHGFHTVWLQVWQKNSKAIKFYQNAGFVVFETAGFRMGNQEQQDFLMRYDLYYSSL